MNKMKEKLYCRKYRESCNNIGYQLMMTTVNKLDRNYNGSTRKTNTIIIQCYKAQTCQGQAHPFISSANTGKSLGGAIRVRKKKKKFTQGNKFVSGDRVST